MASAEKVPMLAEGHRKLNDEVQAPEEVERPEIVEAIEEARAHGDLSENAEYHAAKERQGQIEATIADLEDRLSRAMVIDPTTLVGRQGRVRRDRHPDRRGREEGQDTSSSARPRRTPRIGRISYNSPLGRALIGRQKGEEVEVSTPSGDRYYEIKKIEFI